MNKQLQNFAFCCLLLTFCCILSFAYPPGWSDDILLTPEDSKARMYPDVEVDGNNFVWAVWDSGSWVNNTAEILYSKRDSLGGPLITETEVSTNVSYSLLPRIAVDASNNIHFIWREISPLGMGIGHAKLANDGAVIVPSHLAVNGAGGGSSSPIPEMVMNKYNEMNIIWDETPSGYNQMNWTKLDSMGNPVIPKIKVSLDSFYTYWPGIGVDSMANVHLGYRMDDTIASDRLTYTKINKDGNVLIDNKVLGTGLLPTLIADKSQNIHIVYNDPTGPGNSIKYLKINQSGNILVGPKTLSVHEENARPHMAMDSLQYLHVVWDFDNMIDTMGIVYTKLDTLGNFVVPPMKIVYPPYTPGGGMPRIAVDKNNRLHLVWVDGRLNPGVSTDIFYKRGENEQTVTEMQTLKLLAKSSISVCPNPFSTRALISFPLSRETGKGKVEIFDIQGRMVRDFAVGEYKEMVIWDGTDNAGFELSSGVYFIHLLDSPFSQSVMVILLR